MSDPHRIVSSESEQLILVDAEDNIVGYRSKAEAHNGSGIRHRAFSLFLFNNDGEMLLQQRAKEKRLWPGYWSNSCCSHPRRGEDLETATRRRLDDELNVSATLEHIYHFSYQAEFDASGSENELCHVFLGRMQGDIMPNDSEIESVRFIRGAALDRELATQPEKFTPWFKQEWKMLNAKYAARLADYAM